MKLRIARAAQKDLRNIDAFTLERWGDAQRARYAQLVGDRLELLASEPELGTNLGPRRPELYRLRAGEHFFIYRMSKDRVTVIRVLHVRNDIFSRLGREPR